MPTEPQTTPSSQEKLAFAKRLEDAMLAAGYEPKPAVLEREFNTRHWGKPMTLHGVRRWLRGETLPPQDKLRTLAQWLKLTPEELQFGRDMAHRVESPRHRWGAEIGYQDRELFEAFLKLPVPQRRVVREVILALTLAARARQDSNGGD
ncbi:XRE family transcriptional regulator [uncultured Aquabacterium sp.]|uniref:XRE family transcriptional regulator n=1 Tax=uncultured Aquabacterium sp. TaxID=158753 RepID=UPI0030D435AA|tara:strand:- start:200 stop:646 length:447 start_codon:yes stop_codon:yes gene_type:complete